MVLRYLKIVLKFGVAPAAYVGLLVGLELAGPNYMWESARDLTLLTVWSVALFAAVGGIVGCGVAAFSRALRLRPAAAVFFTVALVTALLGFIDRFGWCYPCHQFLDKRTPHLVYTPAKSVAVTLVLGLGCLLLGAVMGGVAYTLWRSWQRRHVKTAFYCVLVASIATAGIMSYLSIPSRGDPVAADTFKIEEPVGGVDQLLIIIDEGLTWDIIDVLIDEGKLPCIQTLVDSGVRADLATITPTLSHPLWETIATGRNPARHGIGSKISYAYPGMKRGIVTFPVATRFMLPHVFITSVNLGFGSSRPLGPGQRRVKTIWNIASECGIDVGVIGWRNTWPAERVKGFMVSNLLHRELTRGHVFPHELEDAVAGIIDSLPPVDVNGMLSCHDKRVVDDQRVKDRIKALERLLSNDLRYQATAERLFPVYRPSLMALGFLSMDGIGHEFYYEHTLLRQPDIYEIDSYLSGFTSHEIVECLGKVIENAYVFHDSLFGCWVDYAGEESAVIIASDHGFKMDGSNHYYAPPGILILHGKPFKKNTALTGVTIFDIAPTLLYLLGLPVPLDMEGKLLEDAIDPAWLASNPVRTVATYETARH